MKSRFRCLKLRVRVPRGPFTSMILAFTLISIPSGMSIVSDERIVFILESVVVQRRRLLVEKLGFTGAEVKDCGEGCYIYALRLNDKWAWAWAWAYVSTWARVFSTKYGLLKKKWKLCIKLGLGSNRFGLETGPVF
ncbi:hypothetical protein HanHA300_Chr01g0036911 [Helianthus annuus]|nr:hypothetical protein HanHA300_Chr01g0036911 [Helianthus annuus]KAJ0628702.1 hypothetical protein HanHA89_Chr01g0039311 [Helianthus annuus]KAJ0785025.1 hypothetical protein HanLR1_Chr01g0038191 [Helianthus annuus]